MGTELNEIDEKLRNATIALQAIGRAWSDAQPHLSELAEVAEEAVDRDRLLNHFEELLEKLHATVDQVATLAGRARLVDLVAPELAEHRRAQGLGDIRDTVP